MKQINTYRKSNQFFLTGVELDYLAAVRKFVRGLPGVINLVGVVRAKEGLDDDRIDLYTVRVVTKEYGLYDLLVEAATHTPCVILGHAVICGDPSVVTQWR